VPFDHNLAKLDIQMVKMKKRFQGVEPKKVRNNLQLFFVISQGLEKNSVSIFEAIKDAFSSNPFIQLKTQLFLNITPSCYRKNTLTDCCLTPYSQRTSSKCLLKNISKFNRNIK